jgi:hypothetical protein
MSEEIKKENDDEIDVSVGSVKVHGVWYKIGFVIGGILILSSVLFCLTLATIKVLDIPVSIWGIHINEGAKK